jgi:hypothetical protein
VPIGSVTSAFRKTDLEPREYSHVVKQVEGEGVEEEGSASGSSVLSNFQRCALKKYIDETFEEKWGKESQKIANTLQAFQTRCELLEHEKKFLRTSYFEENNSKARDKGLFEHAQ